MAEELAHEEHWREYHALVAQFEAIGIPWNKKGSPHRLLLRAKWHAAQIPFSEMVALTIRVYAPQMSANIATNNALLKHLTRREAIRV